MDDKEERLKKLAELHYKARYKAGKSQEFMAFELGVAKKTIQNWEKGKTSPTFFQTLEWFRVLDINPFPYLLAYTFGNKIDTKTSDKEVNETFDALVKILPTRVKRTLLFIWCGGHGSSPTGVLELGLMYLHTPIKTRLKQAASFVFEYEIEKSLGNDVCQDSLQPDLSFLKSAIDNAKDSVLHNKTTYSNIDRDGQ